MKIIIIYLLLFTAVVARAQEDAWVYFIDKPDADFYLGNPLQMLSQKALDRRAVQGIALDVTDVPLHEPYITAISGTPGITVMAKSKWLNALHIRGTEEAINALTELEFVESVDFANKLLNTSGRVQQPEQRQTVNKFLEAQADFDYGAAQNQIVMLNGHLLHQQNYTGTGITIAVMDSGFPGVDTAAPFQRLFDNEQVLGTYDFVTESEDVYSVTDTHGTLVLSTMGGYLEGEYAGTAPDAFYYLFRTEDAESENPVEESYWVGAAEVADSLGVDIINTSLGYFKYDNPSYDYTYEDLNGQTSFISRGANIAFSRGMVCVTSAGNSGNNENPYAAMPAEATTTLAVGAVNAEEIRSPFSSIGPTSDGRIKPDVMARGVASAVSNTSGSIVAASGTSFSGPITCGLVACLWQALPELTNTEIVQLVKQSADRFNNPDNEYGYGIPDFALALDTASAQQIEKKSIVISPNPATEYVMVSGLESDAEIIIYNGLGQQVYKATVAKNKPAFSVQALPGGIYTFVLQSAKSTQSGKLVKR